MNKIILEELDLRIMPFDSGNLDNPQVDDFTIYCFYNGEQIAYLKAYHESGRLYAFEVLVNEDYRRMGVATRMYNYAESISEKTIHPHHENHHNHSEDVSADALSFWKARRK